jgi:hypothetical protein
MSPAANKIGKMSTTDRVDLAKIKTRKVVDRISALLSLSEQNKLIVYSKTLSGQIPRSLAANAFNVFQHAMHAQEVVQLFALWDSPDDTLAHNSICIVRELIDDDSVVANLAQEAGSFWPHSPSFGENEETRTLNDLNRLRVRIPELVSSDQFRALKNLRDKYLAHALDATRAEAKGSPIRSARYGDEQGLLTETTEIIECLYLRVCGTNFDLEENRAMHGRHAAELWENFRFGSIK